MDRGSYVAASNGFAQLLKLQLVSNNLANVNTPGYKRQVLIGQEQTFEETLAATSAGRDPFAAFDHDRSPGRLQIRTETDFSQGPIQQTNNPLDLALRNPNDFFVVTTANGPRYTRAGNFTLNEQGQIVTPDGAAVNGDGGPITLPNGVPSIHQDGSITVNGIASGKLQVVRIDRPETMVREGDSRFATAEGSGAPTAVEPDVISGALEGANVTAVASVIDLINANRAFELYSKSAQTSDRLNQVAISEVGRK